MINDEERRKQFAKIIREWADDVEKNEDASFSFEVTRNPEPMYRRPDDDIYTPPSMMGLGWKITQETIKITKNFKTPKYEGFDSVNEVKRNPSDTFHKVIDARFNLAALMTKVEPSIPHWRAKVIVNTKTPLKPVMRIIMTMKQIEQTYPYTDGTIKVYEYLAKQLYSYFYQAPFIHKPSHLAQEDLRLRFVGNLVREELHNRESMIV